MNPPEIRRASVAGAERGASAVEYGLLVLLVAAVVVAVLLVLGPEVSALYATVDW